MGINHQKSGFNHEKWWYIENGNCPLANMAGWEILEQNGH
jgi:hypothetical protein